MTKQQLLTGMLIVCAAIVVPIEGSASCNVIPDGGSYQPDPGGPYVPYKGKVGRTNRLYPVVGRTKTITVVADGKCVGADGVAKDVQQSPATADDLVIVVAFGKRADATPFGRVYGSADVCAALTNPAAGGVAVKPKFDSVGGCDNKGVVILSTNDLSKGLKLPLPDQATIASYTDATIDGRIVVMRKPTDVRTVAAAVARAATTNCSNACGEADKLICIDKIYAPAKDAKGQEVLNEDPTACEFQPILATDVNDFQDQCEDAVDDDRLVRCDDDEGGVLKMTLDDCGGVHIPFVWGSIRGSKDPIDRRVSGSSAVGHKLKAKGERVWFPGREFFASTPFDDAKGEEADPHKPNIDVSYARPEQLELVGTVDDDDSIVHIYGRMLVDQLCADGEACYSAAPVNGSGEGCACRDRYAVDCTCRPLSPKQFFACDTGEYESMPCTRPQHCPGGRCIAQPECHAKITVWEKGFKFGAGTRCSHDLPCGEGNQCGYSLFDLRELDEGKTKKPQLDAEIKKNKRHRRGVCKDGGEECSNDEGGPAQCTADDCRGYILRADKKF